jgi:hypothetical protein
MEKFWDCSDSKSEFSDNCDDILHIEMATKIEYLKRNVKISKSKQSETCSSVERK